MPTDREVLDYVLKVAEHQGMHQAALGEALGLTRAAVSNWLGAGRVPDRQFKPLSRLLGKSVDELQAAGREVTKLRHVGDRIRFLRRSRDLTQEEVAEAIRLPLADYQRCEADGLLPETSTFLELARTLGVRNAHWLVHGDPAESDRSSGSTQNQRGGGKP